MNSRMVTLTIGETFHLKRGKDRVLFAGMPSENVYSFVEVKTNGYQGFSWNLFFPRHKREIVIDGVTINIDSVSPEEISFHL